jgi:hypothetical protein
MEKEENQPEVKPTETLVEMNDRDEVDTLVELSEPEVEPPMDRREFAPLLFQFVSICLYASSKLTLIIRIISLLVILTTPSYISGLAITS